MPTQDQYRIESLIARGGMAEVYRAADLRNGGRAVALKWMLPTLAGDPSLAQLFVDEARITGRLAHPNVVAVLDSGVREGRPFQVLSLVDGADAGVLLAREPFPAALALFIAAEVAAALDHAHRAHDEAGEPLHIVHRDVSPSNVLLGRSGEVQISDFGIAVGKDRRERTATGTTKGKAAYMSPEQTLGAPVDGRADVFSLGCTLHALMTGKSPLADPDAMAGLLAGEELPLQPSLPPEVREIVARAVRPRAASRFASMAEMEAACRAVLVEPETLRDELGRWVRAHVPPSEAASANAPRDSLPVRAVPSRRGLAVALLLTLLVLGAGLAQRFLNTPALNDENASETPTETLASEVLASETLASETRPEAMTAPPTEIPLVAPQPPPEIPPAAPPEDLEAHPAVRPHVRATLTPPNAPPPNTPPPNAPPSSPSESAPSEGLRWGVVNFRLPRDARVTLDGGRTPFRDVERGHACDTTGLCHLPVGRHQLVVRTSSGEPETSTLCVSEGRTLRAFAPLAPVLGCE